MSALGLKRTLFIAAALATGTLGLGAAYLSPRAPAIIQPSDDQSAMTQETMVQQLLAGAQSQLPVWVTNNTQYTAIRHDEDNDSFIMTFELDEDKFSEDLPLISGRAALNTELPDGQTVAHRCSNDETITLNGTQTFVEFVDPRTQTAYTQLSTTEILCDYGPQQDNSPISLPAD